MRPTSRVVSVLLAVAGSAALVHANGTIDLSNSTVAVGAAPAPGRATNDPCVVGGPAPALPALGSIGSMGAMTDTMPAFPGGGSGAGGAFHATQSANLGGGTFEFTSYTVDPGVILRYAAATTIRTTGNVLIDGQVIVEQGGGATFQCAGDFSLRSNTTVQDSGIATTGGPIILNVAGKLRVDDVSPAGSEAASAFSTSGGSPIVVMGRQSGSTDPMLLHRGRFYGQGIVVRSATGIAFDGELNTTGGSGGPIVVRAFGGDFVAATSDVYAWGAIDVQASGGVQADRTDFRTWTDKDCTMTAFGGPLVLSNGFVFTVEGGDIRLRAAKNAEFHDGEQAEVITRGSLEMTAFGGDLLMQSSAGATNRFLDDVPGTIALSASGAVTIGPAMVETTQGDVTIRAYGGGATFSGSTTVDAVQGALDVGASGDATAATGTISLSGDSVRVVANRVDLSSDLLARVGDVTLLANGQVSGVGTMESAGSFTATSAAGDVVFDGSTITTTSDVGAKSGDVELESFAGANSGRVAARNATIRTGDNATASGDVRLRVVTIPRPTVTTYLLPTSVALKLGAVKGAGIKASGTIGAPSAWLPTSTDPLPFTLSVGTHHVQGSLATRPNGRDREYRATGVLLRVSPSSTGASKGVFTLQIDGDLTGDVPADGLVDFDLILGETDFAGTVRLTAGKFKLGSTRGAVTELLYPLAVTAQAKGMMKDTLTMTLGFSSDGTTPDSIGDLAISFGDAFATTVAAADFVRSGDRFTAKNPPSAHGITSVVVDFDAETVTVKGKNLDLGQFAATSPVAARIGVAFGGDRRSVDVSLSRKGTKLTY